MGEEKHMKVDLMRIVLVGHVDHGKSTLIGRLFYDTGCIPKSQIEQIRKKSRSQGKEMEFAYLMDAFEEEQNQGITIDTAQTFFKTRKRHYIIIDAPGHKEFLKNMISGASKAEAAILIVDAKEGVREQTKRHAYILSMLGIRKIIAVINKMDSVGYRQSRFEEVKGKLVKFLSTLEILPTYTIPISAKDGENVAKRSLKMKWYGGITILSALDSFKKETTLRNMPLRFPVQDVYKFDDKRIIAGRVEAGSIRVGDTVVFSPSGKETRVKSIEKWKKHPRRAVAGDCIGITMDEQIYAKRGEVASGKDEKPTTTKSFKANVFWMSKNPLKIGKTYLLKVATEEVGCTVSAIHKRVNSSTFKTIEENASFVNNTEVGELIINTKKPVAVDLFSLIPTLGRFVLVDEQVVGGGGIITEITYQKIVQKDLREEVCPFTLEHARPLLENIRKGQTVEILITNLPAVETIGRLAYEHNLEFTFEREKDYIKLTVKSGKRTT